MDIKTLRVGNVILYHDRPHFICNIGIDKLGLIPLLEGGTNEWDKRYLYERDKIFFAKLAQCHPIPLLEVITNDNRIQPCKVKINDKESKPGVKWENYDGRTVISLVEDGKYIGVYRVIIHNKDWGIEYPIVSMAKVHNFHEFQNILYDCDCRMYFHFDRDNRKIK